MKNVIIKSLLVCAILGISTAYWLTDDNADDKYSENENTTDLLDFIEREERKPKRKWCIPLRSPCTHDDTLIKKYSFLVCCNLGACKCNLWGNNCRCEATLRGLFSRNLLEPPSL